MTDRQFELSRRKVLAGVGAIGAAGAATGLGTSALFSDEETFENNTITAGTLDLKVDWEEHYSFPQLYGFDDPAAELDVTRSEPEDPENYQALPDPEIPAVWVHGEDLSAYMDNTAIEAYPDPNNDGVQNDFGTDQVGNACEDGADTPDDLNPGGLRTGNEDTIGDQEGGAPLVNLEDVKPGDFGELTLSFHLCDNPGLVWLGGELVDSSENDLTEPEAASEGEEAGVVELLDEIEATVWYDGDCDNVFEPGGEEGEEGQEVDVVLVLDRSGSMSGTAMDNAQSGAKSLVDALGTNDQVGLVSFADNSSRDADLTSDHETVKTAIDGLTASGGTNIEAGVEQAHEELLQGDQGTGFSGSGNARSGVEKIMIVLSDGSANEGTGTDTGTDPTQEATSAKGDGIELFTIAYGSSADASLEDMASDPAADHFFEADTAEIEDLFESLGGTVGSSGEELITRGTLREVLDELEGDGEEDPGIPLDAEPGSEGEGRACYPALQTNCVGLSWHLPADVGNHVQSDSVSFNVGFYAEQCRNNPEAATPTESGT